MYYDVKRLVSLASTIESKISANGGCTVSESGTIIPTDGYFVGTIGKEDKFALSQLSGRRILAYLVRHETAASQFYGFWVDDGTVYCDVCEHYTSENGAIASGRRNRQRTIWNVKKYCAEEVYTALSPSGYRRCGGLQEHSIGEIYPWSIVTVGNTCQAWHLVSGCKLSRHTFTPNIANRDPNSFESAYRRAMSELDAYRGIVN